MVNIHLDQVKQNCEWLKQYCDSSLKAGCKIDGAPYYTKDDLQTLKEVGVDNILYLRKNEQRQLIKLITNMMEMEVLFEGFCYTLRELQDQNNKLSKEKLDFLNIRAQRILKIADHFPAKINSISMLSYDYAKMNPKELIITNIY